MIYEFIFTFYLQKICYEIDEETLKSLENSVSGFLTSNRFEQQILRETKSHSFVQSSD